MFYFQKIYQSAYFKQLMGRMQKPSRRKKVNLLSIQTLLRFRSAAFSIAFIAYSSPVPWSSTK